MRALWVCAPSCVVTSLRAWRSQRCGSSGSFLVLPSGESRSAEHHKMYKASISALLLRQGHLPSHFIFHFHAILHGCYTKPASFQQPSDSCSSFGVFALRCLFPSLFLSGWVFLAVASAVPLTKHTLRYIKQRCTRDRSHQTCTSSAVVRVLLNRKWNADKVSYPPHFSFFNPRWINHPGEIMRRYRQNITSCWNICDTFYGLCYFLSWHLGTSCKGSAIVSHHKKATMLLIHSAFNKKCDTKNLQKLLFVKKSTKSRSNKKYPHWWVNCDS